MAYSGPKWDQTTPDRRGEFIAEGWKGVSQSITAAGQGLAQMFGEKAKASEEMDFLKAGWDMIPGRMPEDDEKFLAGSLGTKRGMVTSALAKIHAAEQNAPVVPQYQKTASGAGFFVNPKTGGITPEKNIEPDPMPVEETPDPGEWKEMPGMANYLGHWTAKRGFTGATIPKPKDAGTALPQLNFITEPQTGRGIYLDPNGDVVDPAKLLETEEIPGTAKPAQRAPFPFMPGLPTGMSMEIPGTGSPAQRRPVAKQTTANPNAPRIISGPQGVFRQWADGRSEVLEPGDVDAKKPPRWVPVDAPTNGNILMDSPDGGPAAELLPPAGANAVKPFWQR